MIARILIWVAETWLVGIGCRAVWELVRMALGK